MRFSDLITKKSVLLLPFSWLYQAGIFVFHKLYDLGVLPSYRPPVPTICVGNLSVGGTGKSPMVEYIVGCFQAECEVAVLSRGYRRKTKGFLMADQNTRASDIGDEPMQFHQKFPDITVAVDENRAAGIRTLLKRRPATQLVVLDDAFQHRAVRADLNLLLTECTNPFPQDWYLPAGSLRDLKSNYKRAHIIVVTKCDPGLSGADRASLLQLIRPATHQAIFFAAIQYGLPYDIFTGMHYDLDGLGEVVLVTGIANPQPLVAHLKQAGLVHRHLIFPDHHDFTEKDVGDILGTCKDQAGQNSTILTTEKDAVKLRQWPQLQAVRLLALPIGHRILFEEQGLFEQRLKAVRSGTQGE